MSEPFDERMSRFTPDAGRLDRDALLFSAGRNSARSNRGWMWLATLLAGTQTLSLVLLWPRPFPPAGGVISPVARVPAPPLALEPPASRALVTPGLWSARHRRPVSDAEDRPDGGVSLIDSGALLRAFPLPRHS